MVHPPMKTVSQGFREFETQLTTPDWESAAAQSHRASIEACLREQLGLVGFFQSGSFGNGTNVPLHSDVDRFAVFPEGKLPASAIQALSAVHRAVGRRFPTTLGIRIKPPAVIIPFGTQGLETTEVIPAVEVNVSAGYKVYAIPSPSGGSKWIYSAPKALHAHINEVNDTHGSQLKTLIRFLKWWKYQRKVAIQSIYLELSCAAFARHIGLLSPSIDIARILHFLRSNRLAAIHDPTGVSDKITACTTTSQRGAAFNKIRGGASLATRAVTAELEWRIKPAFNMWKMFFGPNFPNPE